MKSLTKTFTIEYDSEIEERKFEGTFTTKKLTIGDHLAMGTYFSELTKGAMNIGEMAFQVASALAHCKVALISRPSWFEDPQKLVDESLLFKVYKEVATFESSFRRNLSAGDEQGRSSTSQGDQATTRTAEGNSTVEGARGYNGPPAQMVERKVPLVTKVG